MSLSNTFILSKSDINNLQNSKLYGYAIFEDSVVFGTDGLHKFYADNNKALKPENGRFAGFFIENEKHLTIKTDITGQELIYVYDNGHDWLISNSFFQLADKVAELYTIELYEPAIVSFHIKNGRQLGEQLISHKTPIHNIRLLPLTWEIRVDRYTGEIEYVKEDFFSKYCIPEDFSYEDEILNFIQQGAGLISAISNFSVPLVLDLSGGYDSRIVLGMMESSNIPSSLKFIKSIEHQKGDFRSATALCEIFKLPINTYIYPQKEQYLSSSDYLRTYFSGSGGSYLPINHYSGSELFKNFHFRLTGYQPTGWDAAIMGTPEKLAKSILFNMEDRPHKEAVKEDFLETLRILGVDSGGEAAMAAYYCALRSRFHYGRSSFKTIGHSYLVTPLMSKSFFLLDIHNRRNGFPPQKIFVDIYSALGKWASETPFEHEGKQFTPDLIHKAIFSSAKKINPNVFKIYGHPHDRVTDTKESQFSTILDFDSATENVKAEMAHLYKSSFRARSSGLFNSNDFKLIEAEINDTNKSLTHSVRKLTHFVTTDAILRIIEKSKHR
ncbi:hypothetical protein [Endozoicomonas numazuensis]|uniref:Asparagine synthetase domain-containing protein n=1 Tax=Endozoicomonas numazuensis TaxID=1137799 RepID=A0A081N164_9GAMM|nr:hypothetical protein [Endozoicomonas numazuensis]KEQ12187.1 hypothetical protein GZ78_27465 [Endozoicomonas numazuensis]